jgi:spore photoproduct lyase
MSLENTSVAKRFSHIYIEKDLMSGEDETVQRVLSCLPDAHVISIDHYKDVFNRKHQDQMLQKRSQALILASKKGRLIYDGAPVCQSFGNEHFCYTSCVMNCLYDCEYCYLKGMYPSGNLCIFTNINDIFAEALEMMKQYPLYLCVSYDTDLLPLEDMTGFAGKWADFTGLHKDLTIEIRTKCGRTDIFKSIPVCERVIFAFTISPDEIISKYEQGTPLLDDRLKAVRAAMEAGFPVRLCFDPVIFAGNFEEIYGAMFEKVKTALDLTGIKDFSVGSFRISGSYLKNMRKLLPGSALIQYPFIEDNGYYAYPKSTAERMEGFVEQMIKSTIHDAEVFRWR